MNLYQGNTYNLKIRVLSHDKKPLNINEIEKVEFTFGSLVKKYPNDGIIFNEDFFIIPLSQEETFSLEGVVKYQVRVKFIDGTVTNTKPTNARISDSLSKEVL